MSQSSFAPEVTLATLDEYIRKDGTTTTTASIPFAEGLSVAAEKYATFGTETGTGARIWFDAGVLDDDFVIEGAVSGSSRPLDVILRAPSSVVSFSSAGGVTVSGGHNTSNTSGAGGGTVVMTGGSGLSTLAVGGSVRLAGGLANTMANVGMVKVGTSNASPTRINATGTARRGSLWVQGQLETDNTTFLNADLYLTSLVGAGILKIDSNELVAVASSSDILSAIGTIDISSNTNLAVTSPITLTGDTVGFDSAANFTWTGIHSFNNTSGITLSSTSPIITFTDTTGSEDDFALSTASGGFQLVNITDSVTAFSISGTGTNTYNAATSGSHIFNVNNAEEARIAANRMTFNNGSSDAYLDWSTNGRLDVGGAARTFINLGATVANSAITPHATGYELSVQSNGGYTYIEILNGYGTGAGAFFGMAGAGAEGDTFELWNYQGGPIHFYTAPTAIDGTVTFKISEDGYAGIQTGKRFYLEMDSSGTLGDTYFTYNSGSGYVELYVNGNLAAEFK